MKTIKLNQIDVESVCRICLSAGHFLRGIHKTRIPKMIESFALVQITEDDGLPHKICATCFHTILKFYSFKLKIEHNDNLLRNFIKRKSVNNSKDIINIPLEVAAMEKINDESINFNEKNIASIQVSTSNLTTVPLLNKQKEIKQTTISLQFNQLLTDGLPPLIPIKPNDHMDVANNLCRDLSEDPPPLVPLKPLVNIKTVENVIELKYKCYICNNQFSNISALKVHAVTTCKPKYLECNVCLKKFNERKKLIGHLKGHMVVKDHMCKICGKKYPNESTFRVHMRSHTGERPFKCQICNKGFARRTGVRLHMKTHEDRRPFSCYICNKTFKISSNLERHKRTHFGIEPYECSYCQKSFSQLENLTIHVRTYHTHERPFLCNICGKGFVNSSRLNRHMWIHSGRKPYKCRMCPKTYSNNTDLHNHEFYHTGKNANDFKNYACDKCHMKFFHPCRLAKHQKVHDKRARCEVCNEVFSDRESYKVHLSSEHGFDECVEETLS